MSLYQKAKRFEQQAIINTPRLPVVVEQVGHGEYIYHNTGERVKDIKALEAERDVIAIVWAGDDYEL